MRWMLPGIIAAASALVAGGLVQNGGQRSVCGPACEKCLRSISQNGTCSVNLSWVAGEGHQGCCFDDHPICPSLNCTWAGTLEVQNVSGGAMTITIYGPGAAKTCAGVPNMGVCTKFFGSGNVAELLLGGFLNGVHDFPTRSA